MACLVTRPDLNSEIYDLLKPRCELDIWQEAIVMPRDALQARASGKHALVVTLSDKVDTAVLDAAGPSLKLVATVSVGFDHIAMDECHKRGVQVANTPRVLTDACAELTIALLLATSRRLLEAERALRAGEWQPGWTHLWLNGCSVKDSVVGIIGLGSIGLAVAKRLAAFEPKRIIYSGNSVKSEAAAFGAEMVALEQLLVESDFVIVCCSLNEKTSNLLDERSFSLMKASAVLINTSRGGVVKQQALYEALKNKKIRAAGLDVMAREPLPGDDPLLALDNVVLLPHIGSAASDTRLAMSVLTARNVLASLDGLPPPGLIVWEGTGKAGSPGHETRRDTNK